MHAFITSPPNTHTLDLSAGKKMHTCVYVRKGIATMLSLCAYMHYIMQDEMPNGEGMDYRTWEMFQGIMLDIVKVDC